LATNAMVAAFNGAKSRAMSITAQDRDGRATPGQRLQKGAKRESDHDRLDAPVVADGGKRAAQDREVPVLTVRL